MEIVHRIADYIRPYGDLCSDVEELCYHSPDIVLVLHKPSERPLDIHVAAFLEIRHLGKCDRSKDEEHHAAQYHISVRNGAELVDLYGRKFGLGQGHPLRGSHCIELRKDENLRNHHSRNCSERIERLGEIQPAGRGLLRAYGTYVGVRGRLKDGEPCEQHEDGQEEEDVSGSIVHKGHLGGRIEQECSQRI